MFFLLDLKISMVQGQKITDPAKSELNGILLKNWCITADIKQYYQHDK